MNENPQYYQQQSGPYSGGASGYPQQGYEQQQMYGQQPGYGQQQMYSQAPAQPQVVGVGKRFLALLIDAILLGIVISIIEGVLIAGTKGSSAGTSLAGILSGLIAFCYFLFMEARGATLGKRLLGLRVVKMDGSPMTLGASFMRNLLRIIDGLFGYLLGAIFIWTSPLKQRLGDRVAKTLVVQAR